MKKFVSAVLLCILCVLGVGCGDKQSGDVSLKAPDSIEKDIEVETLDDGIKLYEGYMYVKDREGNYKYFPYVENKMDGVLYVDDANLEGRDDKEAVLRSFNKPQGCDIMSVYGNITDANSLSKNSAVPPQFAWPEGYREDPEYLKIRDTYLHMADTMFNGFGGKEHDTSVKLRGIDVQAVSFAMYEDFYEEPQTVNVSIYGVKMSLIKEKLGDTCTEDEVNNMTYEIHKSGYKEADLLASKFVDTTGVYYIDWKALDINSDYGTYIVALDFKDDIHQYCINGANFYEIKDAAEYDVWKKANKDRFIAG